MVFFFTNRKLRTVQARHLHIVLKIRNKTYLQGTTGGTLVNGVPVLALEQTGESSNESVTNGDQEAEPPEDPIATTPPHFITVTGKAFLVKVK